MVGRHVGGGFSEEVHGKEGGNGQGGAGEKEMTPIADAHACGGCDCFLSALPMVNSLLRAGTIPGSLVAGGQ